MTMTTQDRAAIRAWLAGEAPKPTRFYRNGALAAHNERRVCRVCGMTEDNHVGRFYPEETYRPRGKQETPAGEYVEPFDIDADWEELA